MRSDREKHKIFTRALRGLHSGETAKVPKSAVGRLPRSYERTFVGTPPELAVAGGRDQFRGPWNRHVYGTEQAYFIHRDSADPRKDPIAHLILDAPDLATGGVVGAVAGLAAGSSTYKRDIERGVDEKTAKLNAVVDGVFTGAMGF